MENLTEAQKRQVRDAVLDALIAKDKPATRADVAAAVSRLLTTREKKIALGSNGLPSLKGLTGEARIKKIAEVRRSLGWPVVGDTTIVRNGKRVNVIYK
jgi:hypothetical protein